MKKVIKLIKKTVNSYFTALGNAYKDGYFIYGGKI